MRTAGLSVLAGLTALHTISVNGDVACNTKALLSGKSAVSISGTQDRLSSTVSALCHTPLGEVATVSEHLDGLVLQLRRSEVVQDADDCQAAFSGIISQCIETGMASGGKSVKKGISYVVLPGSLDDHPSNSKYTRAPPNNPKGSSGQPNSSARKPTAGNPAAGKSPAGKPATNPPPQKPPTTPAKPTDTRKQTKIKVGPTKDCKQLLLDMERQSSGGRFVRDVDEARGNFVGSRVYVNSRGEISKRAEFDGWYSPNGADVKTNHRGNAKPGTACGIFFAALDYPNAKNMPPSAPYFSIDTPDNFCENIKFQETTTAILGPLKYHIEHILEWQTVASFFDWMDRKGQKYKHPDSSKAGDIGFCTYWVDQWQGSYQQPLTINGKTGAPLDHMAQAFPGVKNREEEFVWLQGTINTPAKSGMWAYKKTKDNSGFIHDEDKMRKFITGTASVIKGPPEKVAAEIVDGAKKALLRLKAVLGARKYMRQKKVSDIFKKQKEEIGKMLDLIDTNLPSYPRKPTKGDRVIASWIKQDLGKHWNEYMDERFKIALTRTHNEMDTYLKLLDHTWCEGRPKSKPNTPANSRPTTPKSGSRPGTPDPIENLTDLFGAMDFAEDVKIKDLCRFLVKVQKEWDMEKVVPWTKPW